jgi:hypothetical protein
MVIAGGEGPGSGELEGTMAHLLVCLGARNGGRRGIVDGEQSVATEVDGGEGVPVKEWRWEGAGKFHWSTAKQIEESWWLGKLCGGRSTADRSLPTMEKG